MCLKVSHRKIDPLRMSQTGKYKRKKRARDTQGNMTHTFETREVLSLKFDKRTKYGKI